ncbi:DNA-binding response regulator [Lysinibacillus sp. KCTC 33748]|uniref:response regulator transcription factor n=1 Tax=unclassified Lysinibacillus TaxID=2636778 RepID=UPI0009A8EFA1|nr:MULTISPECIES: response regulator transcription factor [unclassified Lysinibacillus]OXS70042.1 DNA-binding response regulator [Lysinibacillus sp. KCTC 33748]SKC06572.1 DNA-binding response regulator, OmpR family, contains REC and winged-helix (wHTH) domain [Lysinibacillus sp. AC-3]
MQDVSILVLEDERAIAEMIEIILRKEGFLNITLCDTVQEAKKKMETQVFDFYLLDIMLPDGSGLDMANMIREQSEAPIFFLTAKGSDADKLRGFMNGADDYITKPFNPLELVARVKVQLTRYIKKKDVPESHIFSCSRFTFDVDAAEVTVNGTKEIISGRLFHLLKYLCENAGQVLSKEQIYERVWGDCLFDDNTVMVHIRKLREKIEKKPGKPTCIITVRGIGYKLVGDVHS